MKNLIASALLLVLVQSASAGLSLNNDGPSIALQINTKVIAVAKTFTAEATSDGDGVVYEITTVVRLDDAAELLIELFNRLSPNESTVKGFNLTVFSLT